MARQSRPEEIIHRAIAEYLSVLAPRTRVDAPFIWFHVPNGGGRSKAEGGVLKALGALAGVPDILIIDPMGRVRFGEVKPPKKDLSDSQQVFERALYRVCAEEAQLDVWRSVDDCRDSLKKWGLV